MCSIVQKNLFETATLLSGVHLAYVNLCDFVTTKKISLLLYEIYSLFS